MAGLLIGDVAERTGLTAPTIRYYESIKLLAPAPRSATGYRRYSDTTVEELRFIKKAQSLGFSLEEIGEILRLSRAGDTPCSHVLDLSRRHLQAIDEKGMFQVGGTGVGDVFAQAQTQTQYRRFIKSDSGYTCLDTGIVVEVTSVKDYFERGRATDG